MFLGEKLTLIHSHSRSEDENAIHTHRTPLSNSHPPPLSSVSVFNLI